MEDPDAKFGDGFTDASEAILADVGIGGIGGKEYVSFADVGLIGFGEEEFLVMGAPLGLVIEDVGLMGGGDRLEGVVGAIAEGEVVGLVFDLVGVVGGGCSGGTGVGGWVRGIDGVEGRRLV